ncbi:MAG: hypothetical protein ACNYPE_11260 [Candidatus Azotimanducaceae bacterium WSBS_2022_MAG_OTU7]
MSPDSIHGFYHFGFTVHPDTTALIVRMVNEGQIAELTPERIHSELDKALNTKDPAVFFDYLVRWVRMNSCGPSSPKTTSITFDCSHQLGFLPHRLKPASPG